MNQIFAGGIALLKALVIWVSGNKSRKASFISNQKSSFIGLNRQDLSLVQSTVSCKDRYESYQSNGYEWAIPKNAREKIILTKTLSKLIKGSPNERLDAIQITSEWQAKECLPFILRGLRDSDSRVVIAAAAIIGKYKSNIQPKNQNPQSLRPPLNVALMR